MSNISNYYYLFTTIWDDTIWLHSRKKKHKKSKIMKNLNYLMEGKQINERNSSEILFFRM